MDDRILTGLARLNGERGAAPFGIGGLDGVRETRTDVVVDLHPIDDHLERRPIPEPRHVHVFERDGLAIQVETTESLAPQRRKRLGNGIDEVGQDRLRLRALIFDVVADGLFFVEVDFPGHHGRGRDDGHVEPDQQPRAGRERAHPGRHDLRRLADDLLAAGSAQVRPTLA